MDKDTSNESSSQVMIDRISYPNYIMPKILKSSR